MPVSRMELLASGFHVTHCNIVDDCVVNYWIEDLCLSPSPLSFSLSDFGLEINTYN